MFLSVGLQWLKRAFTCTNLHEARVLYFDTDSVIYKTHKGQEELPLGTLLGEFTSESRQDENITTFVSAGPKNYAYETN